MIVVISTHLGLSKQLKVMIAHLIICHDLQTIFHSSEHRNQSSLKPFGVAWTQSMAFQL
jgi:hypothetical protein